MALIRANRESIDDRFSVLGFTVRTDAPMFEIGLATDPELLKGENRGRRSRSNFFSSTVLGTGSRRGGESVYLVPPSVVARFAGQQKLYFGLATYQEGNRSLPVEVRIPDRGHMYVNLAGLTERGLRRTARIDTSAGYGTGSGDALRWGGDALTTNGSHGTSAPPRNGNGAQAAPGEAAGYSDGYSDDLWQKGATTAPSPAPEPMLAPAPAASGTAAASAQSYRPAPSAYAQSARNDGYGYAPSTRTPPLPARPPLASPLLVGPYYKPEDWWGALTTQIGHFARGAMWFLGVADTTQPPYSAICQVRTPDGSAEGAHRGTAFFIGPRLLLTAAHVVDGMSELIIVPGKNGGGISGTTEPFGRFHVTTFEKHPSYGSNGSDHDMALICVPQANAAQGANYFNLVEELTQSRPEGVVVSGYAAWWHAVSQIEHYVNANIDENRQHMHGGHIREIPTDGTFTYDLQTLAGTSGSPVYWIEEGATPQAHLVGVHVAANDDSTNKGCRITQEKLNWIRNTAAAWGQTLTFSLGARALDAPAAETPAEDDPEVYGICEGEPEYVETATAQAVRALTATSPDYPGTSRFAPAHANNFRVGRRGNATVDRIVIHITAGGPNINATIAWFQNGNRTNPRTGKPIRSSSHYVVGRDGEVVQMVRNADTAHHASAVNPRSIGIEHNANKPYGLNKRDLPPTEPQYEASARLVAWLCQQYGLPIDRTHIIGHFEASPRDNHDCPSDYWNWEHYMACVQLAASQLASGQGVRALGTGFGAARRAPASRGPASRGPASRGLEIISPFYDPADPSTALTCQDDAFSLAREEWFMGVPNTSIFPHSAICQLNMTAPDGSQYSGTGFYIGRNRILTCAHNLQGMSRCEIIPGRNGAGNRPFGSTTVQSSSWRLAPRYTGDGDWDNDLAVIDNVPIAAPGGHCFEFLNATPSNHLPVVVCGYSAASRKVPELDYIIDGDKQHLHGGYVSTAPTFDTIDYPILSLMGASGSPVYTLTRADGTLKAKICAVHVSGEPADQGLNRGCFITPAKIDWIEGRATTFALGAPVRALVIGPEDVERAQRHAPHWADLFNWTAPASLNGPLAARNMSIQRIQDAHGELNLDRYEVRCTALPAGWTDVSLLNHVRTHLNEFLDTRNSEFIPYAAGTDDAQWGSASPVGAVFKIDIVGPDNAAVVGSLVDDRKWRFTTINAPWSGNHPVSGHREFGVRTEGDATVFYTRGADRATDGVAETVVFAGSHHLWQSFQRKLTDWINANGGSATVGTTFSERFHPEVVRILYGGASAQSLGARALEIPLDPGIGGMSIGLDALAPGDIIVSTARHAVSFAIRAGTLSAISHAMIYVGNGHVVEAVGDGVREVPLATAIGDAILAVAYRDPRVDAARAQALVDFARAQVGQPYNYGGVARLGHRIVFPLQSRIIDAIRSLTGTDETSARSFFCSELVFAAFEAAGIPLVASHAGDNAPQDLVALTRGSLGYVGHLKARDEFLGIALGLSAQALSGGSDYPVHLIPQPDKNACWAASMAMLLSFRRNQSLTPETLANDVGASLATSYNWDLLSAVRDRYGFEILRQPDNASIYHSPQQWADWLATYGPLWVVIVGAPHAVVLAGIRGNLADPASVQVKILNPWDTRVAFDNDAVDFHPRNNGYEDWLSFNQFASDFGNMAEPNYGNWRVLHLPAQAVTAQSLGRGGYALKPAPAPRLLGLGDAVTGESQEPIEPSRVPGTRMHTVRGTAGACRWALDQVEGLKSPATPNLTVSSASPGEVTVELNDWPAFDGAPCPLPLTLSFRASQGSVGDVRIRAGAPANLAYGVEAVARIEDHEDLGGVAVVRVTVDYRFSGLAQGNPAARIQLRLLGDGRLERENSWIDAGGVRQAA